MGNVLITWGGWNGHEPEKTAGICADMLSAKGHDVTVTDVLDPFADEEFMAQVDLVVPVWTKSRIGQAEEAGVQRVWLLN